MKAEKYRPRRGYAKQQNMRMPLDDLPVLYSFRRCPYAMRARMALRVSGVVYAHREVELKAKPEHLLNLSPKGTVPVLWLPLTQTVLDESLDIMRWALAQNDPQHWLPTSPQAMTQTLTAIARNDQDFKYHLDRYKYPQRFGLAEGRTHRDAGAALLMDLERQLQAQAFLSGEHWGLLDASLAPFVRQFAHTQPTWFAAQPWPALLAWLQAFEASDDFVQIMQKHPLWQADAL
jgi:glutathione S-transferase